MTSKRTIKSREGGFLIAVIGDEDTATGFLLAGVGQNEAAHGSNYFVVDPSKPRFLTPFMTVANWATPCYVYFANVVFVASFLKFAHHFCIEGTAVTDIEEAFKKFTERDDVAILLINQYVSKAPW